MPLQRRIPKRGFTNIFAKDYTVVRLDRIAPRFKKGDTVDVDSLKALGLIKQVGKDGVKILSNGEITVALKFKAAKFTKAAAEKIAAAGGTVEIG